MQPEIVSRYSQRLQRDERGVWVAGGGAAVSYPAHGHADCWRIEDGSFWFRHRNRCILAAIERHPPRGPVFDVGGGNGFVAAALAGAGREVVLVEPGPQGAANASARGLRNVVCATLDDAGFAPGSLPAVGLFDVVEHVRDDGAFLRMVAALTAADGLLYVTVPAHRALWSAEDAEAGHFRRYDRPSLQAVVGAAGYETLYCSYFFRPLVLPIAMSRALPYRLGLRRRAATGQAIAREHGSGGGWAARAMQALLEPEAGHVAAGRTMHHGASILLVARRRANVHALAPAPQPGPGGSR
jgi:SAM-dependent methyltransferase